MRLFLAVCLDRPAQEQIAGIRKQLQEAARHGRYTRPENLHLTLVFLGETPEDKIPAIRHIMRQSVVPAFDLTFRGLGTFSAKRNDLWWLGPDRRSSFLEPLHSLQESLCIRLRHIGFPVDNRPRTPHITLAREVKLIRPPNKETPAVFVPVRRISLMKSERTDGVLMYSEVAGVTLPVATK